MHYIRLVVALLILAVPWSTRAAEPVKLSLFSWPGYGFWFIAKEKGLAEGLELDISIIEDPYQSFGLMTAGELHATSSTAEYGPIAADKDVGIKLVTYTNPSYGTDRIILAPGITSAEQLKGKTVAVLEGGLTQIFMAEWLTDNGVGIDEVNFTNLIMDDAVGAMVGGTAAAAEFWEPFGTQVLEALPGATVAADSTEEKYITTAMLGDALYMSTAFLEERPEDAAKLTRAYFNAVDFWKSNTAEANQIIAKGLKFEVKDVEHVLGSTGEIHKGGIFVFDREQAAIFMGLKPGELPLNIAADGMKAHWDITTDWWLKFGFIDKAMPMSAGVDTTPLAAALQ
ncbi:MAG: ABC transporter substrate-binding protein [Gammaproteobacteria bacterium]|jgi:NitT/TauT family transport system substrate-binding protein|nr:ABC transporter substrate-binding protein [Gammaproteobacteria bacterium]